MAVPPEAKHSCILFIIPFPSDAADPASLELEIPLDDLKQLVLRPVRWLQLVAWGVLNCIGKVLDANNFPLDEDMLFDQLAVPETYTFLPDHTVGNFGLLNLEHVRTGRSECASTSSDSDSHDSYLPDQEAELAARDGGKCVFTGGDPVDTAQFIPRRFGRNLKELRDLAHERGFAFDHHLDIRNRITLAGDIRRSWQLHKQVFILATDPSFVRKQDVPPSSAPLPAVAKSPAGVEPAGETYILQTLHRVLSAHSNLRKYVPFNASARFFGASQSHAPCPRAVNYVYAAAMVELYHRPQPGIARLLLGEDFVVRPDSPSGSRQADEQEDFDRAMPSMGRRGNTRRSPPQRRRRDKPDLTPLEKLYLLADAPALRQAERLRQQDDETKGRRLQEWRAESATISPSNTIDELGASAPDTSTSASTPAQETTAEGEAAVPHEARSATAERPARAAGVPADLTLEEASSPSSFDMNGPSYPAGRASSC